MQDDSSEGKTYKTSEEVRARTRAWYHARYEANREKYVKASRAYYQANREKRLVAVRAYQKKNKEKIREYDRTRQPPGYSAVHRWLLKHYVKTGVCSECGLEKKTEWAFQRHPEPHTRDIADYREMCSSCHKRFDS